MTNKYQVIYLAIAKQDLDQIFDYILRDNPNAALQLLDDIDQKISQLRNFPEIGRIPKDNKLKNLGYRILIITGYLVFYIIKGQIVEIHRLLHGSRDYMNLL